MKIQLIDFGGKAPVRAHYNDAGADVFTNEDVVLWPHATAKIPLGIGIKLPDGFAAFIMPRSGKASNEGLTTEIVPIDSGYTGQIHAIVYNANDCRVKVEKGTRIAQLVIVPIVIANLEFDIVKNERGSSGFGDSGDKWWEYYS